MKVEIVSNIFALIGLVFMKSNISGKQTEEDYLFTSNTGNSSKNIFLKNIQQPHKSNNTCTTTKINNNNYNEDLLREGIEQLFFQKESHSNEIESAQFSQTGSKPSQEKNISKTKSGKTKNNTWLPKKRKKKGKVFVDTREDMLHYKLIDNMMFKPLNNNDSASIVFSDESEITQADIDQAIEGRDGSCIAIPLKRKNDVYKEFMRWAHLHEKNEKIAKLKKEVIIQRHKNKTLYNNITKSVVEKKSPNKTVSIIDLNNLHKNHNHTNTGKVSITIKPITSFRKGGPSFNFKTTQEKGKFQNAKAHNLNNTKDQTKYKSFKVESLEIHDPDFLDKLHNTIQNQSSKKKGKKNKQKKQKQRQTYEGNPTDISASDYSAQEAFMLNTQKEAMGRRFYQMFINKTASDFWDNNTLETTKMLEVLIPLGEHLHKTLENPPPFEGNNFMKDLQMYKTELEKFIILVKKDKAETRNDVVAMMEEPYDHLSETKYSEDEIKILFDWEEQEFQQFEILLKEIREMWFDMQLFHHCYQYVSESAESYYSGTYNCTNQEMLEIIQNNTWQGS